MLKIGIIGIGNAGNQVAALAKQELAIPAIAINTSQKDLEMTGDGVKKYLIKPKSGESQGGAGKNRNVAKEYLRDSILTLLENNDIKSTINSLRVVFVVSSTGGGTGSGASLMLSTILNAQYPQCLIIPIGILPVEGEALSAQANTLEYLSELYNATGEDTAYMLYDNNASAELSTANVLKNINEEIVKDLKVLTGFFNISTPYDSIDDADMVRLISLAGRLMVTRVEGIRKDADVEDALIKGIKSSVHCEMQRDKVVKGTGVITNMDSQLQETFDTHMPKVRDFIGIPYHDFNHIGVNEVPREPNNIYLIMSGLSPVADYIDELNERIDKIRDNQKTATHELDLSRVGTLNNEIGGVDKKKKTSHSSVDLSNIFAKFNI